jgi:hypothetical protein
VTFYFFISFILVPLIIRNIIVRFELIKKIEGYFLYSKYLNFNYRLLYLIKNDNFFLFFNNVQDGLFYLYKQLFRFKKNLIAIISPVFVLNIFSLNIFKIGHFFYLFYINVFFYLYFLHR